MRSFSYTPLADFNGGVSLTFLELDLVRSVSYNPRDGFSEEIFLHISC